jgi:hypothetical protein
MEKENQEKIVSSEQGINAEKIFHGKSEGHTSEMFYAESAGLFANIISKEITPSIYTLVDLGGHKGELLSDVLSKLSGYTFDSTVIDKVEGLGEGIEAKKVIADIEHTPIESKSADVVLLRYVLAWNTIDDQRKILKEVIRITKGIAIIQHQGADSLNPQLLSEAQTRLFGGDIPELKRDVNFLWTDPRKLEEIMTEQGIKFSTIQDRKIEGLSNLFIEKYGLVGEKAEMVRKILHDCDYVMQTTWLLDFRSEE